MKKYKIVNDFIDIYTNKPYTVKDGPIELTSKRFREIEDVEKALGYTLIEEVQENMNTEKIETENKNNN